VGCWCRNIGIHGGFIYDFDAVLAVVILVLGLNFVMQNTIRFKIGKRDQANKLVVEFLSLLDGEAEGFRGYMVMNSTADKQSSVVLTFWENKQSMDTYYRHQNSALSDFAQKLTPLVEKMEQIQAYQTEIADFSNVKVPITLYK